MASNAAADVLPDITKNQEVDLLNLSNCSSQNTNALPKERSFDLLGAFETAEAQGNNAMPDLLSNSQTKPPGLDDIFNSFNTPPPANSHSTLPDLSNLDFNAFGSASRPPPSNTLGGQDPFGNSINLDANSVPLLPTSKETSPQQAPTILVDTNKDPFADLGNLASGLNLNWSGQAAKPSPMSSAHSTQVSSPVHQFSGFAPNPNISASASPRGPSTPVHQARSPIDPQQAKPDYSRTHFDTKPKPNGNANSAAGTAGAAAGGGDIFADILGQQGYNFASKANQGPRSINAMRKEELVKEMDPEKLKILEWVSRNIIGLCFLS